MPSNPKSAIVDVDSGLIQRLKDVSLQERSRAITEFKKVIVESKRYDKSISIPLSWSDLLDAYFKSIQNEKTLYLKKASDLSIRKLSRSAVGLKDLVQAATPYLCGARYVKRLFKNINYLVTTTQGDHLLHPVLSDSLKALDYLLDCKAHVEHLEDVWPLVLRFCQLVLHKYQEISQYDIQEAGVVIKCLHHLYQSSNTMIQENVEDTITILVYHLKYSTAYSSSLLDTLATLTIVAKTLVISRLSLAKDLLTSAVPILHKLWLIPELQENILAFMIVTSQFLKHYMITESFLKGEMKLLAVVMYKDYSTRQHKDQLNLDSIEFTTGENKLHTLPSAGSFTLKRGREDAESNWMTVYTIAVVSNSLDQSTKQDASQDNSHHTRKRVRLTNLFQDYVQNSLSTGSNSSIASLQVLSMMINIHPFPETMLMETMESIMPLLSHNNTSIISWALVLLSNCVNQHISTTSDIWLRIWDLALRVFAAQGTARASANLASILLQRKLVSIHDVLPQIETMLQLCEISGPGVLSDSVVSFWTTLLSTLAQEQPGLTKSTQEKIFRWILSKWIPSSFNDEIYVRNLAVNLQTIDIVKLINLCLGSYVHPTKYAPTPYITGFLSRIWDSIQENDDLGRYLLLSQPSGSSIISPDSELFKFQLSHETHINLIRLIVEYCDNEIQKIHEKIEELKKERFIQRCTPQWMKTISSLIIVSDTIISMGDFHQVSKLQDLKDHSDSLTEVILQTMNHPSADSTLVNGALYAFCDILPSPSELLNYINHFHNPQYIFRFMNKISEFLKSRDMTNNTFEAIDSMDIDTDFMGDVDTDNGALSQLTQSQSAAFLKSNKITAFYAEYEILLNFYPSPEDILAQMLSNEQISDRFHQYLDKISITKALAGWQSIHFLLKDFVVLNMRQIAAIIPLISDEFTDYFMATNENAICACIDLMVLYSDKLDKIDDDLIVDIYDFILDGIEKQCLSIRSTLRFIDLLFALLVSNGLDYKISQGSSSLKEMILKQLDGDCIIMAHVTNQLPSLFTRLPLNEHEAVFDQIAEHLPLQGERVETLAIRLKCISKMATSWHSLLRRSIYRIFETAGKFENAECYAAFCVSELCTELSIETEQILFKSLASQLTFTWLQTGNWLSMPFSIFKYTSLKELLTDIEDEAVAQAFVNEDVTILSELTDILESDVSKLVYNNFARIAAYSFYHDEKLRRSDGNSQGIYETKLRSMFDSNYGTLLRNHLALIISIMFSTAKNQEDSMFVKLLQRDNDYRDTSLALNRMKSLDSTATQIISDQQPNYRLIWLFLNLPRLGRRMSQNMDALMTEALYMFIIRYLLNKIQSFLGSFHTCSVLRKVRILVAAAFKVSSNGYALEATLQSLVPYLLDPICIGVTGSIVLYLLETGSEYLSNHISFIAGYIVSVRLHIKASAKVVDETTSRAIQDFEMRIKQWYKSFILNHEALLNKNISAFNQIMDDDFSYQEMLLFIYTDSQSNTQLFTKSARNKIVELLSRQFTLPASRLTDPTTCTIDLAKHLWHSCKSAVGCSDDFLLWSGSVIGLIKDSSDSATSLFSDEESLTPSAFSKYRKVTSSLDSKSSEIILSFISNVLRSNNTREVAFAEQTLRAMLSVKSQALSKHISSTIDDSIQNGLKIFATDSPIVIKTAVSMPWYSPNDPFPAELEEWLQNTVLSYSKSSRNRLLTSLSALLIGIPRSTIELFPPILHLLLFEDLAFQNSDLKKYFSDLFRSFFEKMKIEHIPAGRELIKALLYLREQPLDESSNIQQTSSWLDIDPILIARTAQFCKMYSTALIFAETATNQVKGPRGDRRRSQANGAVQMTIPTDLLLSVYRNIDEPDSYYGVHETVSLDSVIERLQYEDDGYKSLLFSSARLDSKLRNHVAASVDDQERILDALSQVNLNSVAFTLHQTTLGKKQTDHLDNVFSIARKLEQWDIPVPGAPKFDNDALLKVFQALHSNTDATLLKQSTSSALVAQMKSALKKEAGSKSLHQTLETLRALSEVHQLTSQRSSEEVLDQWNKLTLDDGKNFDSKFETSDLLLSSRETLFSVIAGNEILQRNMGIDESEARQFQLSALLESCKSYTRANSSMSPALATVTYLHDLSPTFQELGINNVEISIMEVLSKVLWTHGEQTASINILRKLIKHPDLSANLDKRATILAQLGQYVAEARLESAEGVLNSYLTPAMNDLKNSQGADAGKVIHQFAVFCDKQLHDSDFQDDFNRVSQARLKRKKEVAAYIQLIQDAQSKQEGDKLKREYKKSKLWSDLDDKEWQRLNIARLTMIVQSLEYYLKSLAASDDFDTDALRLFSMWQEYSDVQQASETVAKLIFDVPNSKIAILLNQLGSILQQDDTVFQKTVQKLIFTICVSHPYHGLHHIFAGANGSGSDPKAVSRKQSMDYLKKKLTTDVSVKSLWNRIYMADTIYHSLAISKDKSNREHAGQEIALETMSSSRTMMAKVPGYKLPPPTLDIPLRKTANYSDLPVITSYKSRMSIASGLSAPKIVTSIGSDGKQYKELYKGGNDDLRQDAIMEQVFDQASLLLKNHQAARQRRLHIRTYKVLPLSIHSGIIEFVQHTLPLGDYLNPAHEKYYPNDYLWNKCREKLHGIHSRTKDPKAILDVYRDVTAKFHPVLQYFFLERFLDPDIWFSRRLAYTRTTAAISILGHVLGLGDRHCQNILLDEKTGEVVHIDLGVAFEAGRVLPVPEVVPFRLTRDLVAAMGCTGTEGVFRRGCEFTMDALREERESIVTLLNVLRYDPLVNWTVSPLRAMRMQMQKDEEAEDAVAGTAAAAAAAAATTAAVAGAGGGDEARGANHRGLLDEREDEDGQAGRALMVVERKLSKMLSTAATVNELIHQALNEANLAVLYPGWAPWA